MHASVLYNCKNSYKVSIKQNSISQKSTERTEYENIKPSDICHTLELSKKWSLATCSGKWSEYCSASSSYRVTSPSLKCEKKRRNKWKIKNGGGGVIWLFFSQWHWLKIDLTYFGIQEILRSLIASSNCCFIWKFAQNVEKASWTNENVTHDHQRGVMSFFWVPE